MTEKRLNKWQRYYIEHFAGKRLSKGDKENIALFEGIEDKFVVHFPEFKSPIASQCSPAYVKEFTITEYEDNFPEGLVSVLTAISNLRLWISRGYVIE